jgi:hypothetical protein
MKAAEAPFGLLPASTRMRLVLTISVSLAREGIAWSRLFHRSYPALTLTH